MIMVMKYSNRWVSLVNDKHLVIQMMAGINWLHEFKVAYKNLKSGWTYLQFGMSSRMRCKYIFNFPFNSAALRFIPIGQ